MDGRGPEADQEKILRFVDHKAFNLNYEHSVIYDMPVVIRDKHLRAGLPDGPPKVKQLVNIAIIDLSETRRETPAWLRASVAALEAEARQIEREAAREAVMDLKLEAARAEVASEFVAEHDREAVAMAEDRANALGRKIPASKGMLRWIIAHLDLSDTTSFWWQSPW